MGVQAFCDGAIGIIMASILMMGCGPIRSASTVNVQFDDSVQGLQRGDNVYLFGVPVGVIEAPTIVNGRPNVPLVLRDINVFGQDGQVLFYIDSDATRPGRQALVAVIHSMPAAPDRPRFRGFSSTSGITQNRPVVIT